ncbi:hypothetical protein K438DRAFT_719772 [Mycena galopus ATCC 62051]|nr:hypothetical protein K438DRAFT_719772 [Mycena galopus ATCC 62051]
MRGRRCKRSGVGGGGQLSVDAALTSGGGCVGQFLRMCVCGQAQTKRCAMGGSGTGGVG